MKAECDEEFRVRSFLLKLIVILKELIVELEKNAVAVVDLS